MHPKHIGIEAALERLPEGWLLGRIKRRKSADPEFQIRVTGTKLQMHGYGDTIAEAILDAVEHLKELGLEPVSN